MLEKDIEKHLREKVKDIKGKSWKWVSPGNAGVPDRIVMLPGGWIIFVELKASGKKSTPLQEVQQKRILDLGFEVLVLDSKEAIDDFIKQRS